MTEYQNYDDYLNELRNAEREQGKAKLRAVILHFNSALQRLPALKQEMDLMLQSNEALDYDELLKRVEPVLQQVSDWLLNVDRLPSDLANDTEIKKDIANILATLVLANAGRLIPGFYSFKYKIMEDREKVAREKAENERQVKEEELKRQQQEADPNYQFELAMSLTDNYEKAKWLEKAANQGHEKAKYEFDVICYELAKDEQGNVKYLNAIEWLMKITQKTSKIEYELGKSYDMAMSYDKALYWLKKSANQNNLDAQYKLSYYFKKICIIEHFDTWFPPFLAYPYCIINSIYWLMKAVQNNDYRAKEELYIFTLICSFILAVALFAYEAYDCAYMDNNPLKYLPGINKYLVYIEYDIVYFSYYVATFSCLVFLACIARNFIDELFGEFFDMQRSRGFSEIIASVFYVSFLPLNLDGFIWGFGFYKNFNLVQFL